MSGEDLANVGPVALLNDLTVMSSLGINHVERNGHHYFQDFQCMIKIPKKICRSHEDLYSFEIRFSIFNYK